MKALAGADWIATPKDLERAAQGWRAATAIAVDTEFVRERTFYARLGLVQVADPQRIALVDTVALSGAMLAPLAAILADPAVLKVIHSASEDIEVLARATGEVPHPLLDTQVAAVLAGMTPPPGYQRLVAELLTVEIAKDETRTDWTRRPLSPAQLTYAALDVAHLLPAAALLRQRLGDLGRWEWALADSQAVIDSATRDEPAENAYLRVRAAERMTRRQLGALRALAAWRDDEARHRDLPRRFVLRDELLVSLAQKRPKALPEIAALKDYDAKQGERDAATWLEILERETQTPESQLPPTLPTRSALDKQIEDDLRELVEKLAAAMNLSPEALASRRQLRALVTGRSDPAAAFERLGGWRREVLGPALTERLRRADSAAPAPPSSGRPPQAGA